MNIKTSTKEKFIVIYILEENITANMAAAIMDLANMATIEIPHLIINMAKVKETALPAATNLALLQQSFYDKNCSLLICELHKNVEQFFEDNELLDNLNTAPTESEAWDILQMEEIERELLDGFD